MRLDEIITNERLVTGSQLAEAIEYQQNYGGRLENHLLRFGYIGESDILKALKIQTNCKTIAVSDLTIPESTLKMIPIPFVWKNLILPFEYDDISRSMKIATDSPFNDKLAEELSECCPNMQFEFYLAVGSILQCTILRLYRPLVNIHSALPDTSEHNETVRVKSKNLDINRIYDELKTLDKKTFAKAYLIQILNDERYDIVKLVHNLYDQGFNVSVAGNINQLNDQLKICTPSAMVIIKSGSPNEVIEYAGRILSNENKLDKFPIFLLTEKSNLDDITVLLSYGIEDIIPIEGNLDNLLIKISRGISNQERENTQRINVIKDLGTSGTLEDFNLIDLIQSMGNSQKTALLNVTASGKCMTAYIYKGQIVHAECDDLRGDEAVYLALTWHNGIWCIDPIDKDELPESNISGDYQTILLEGCRRMDEKNRDCHDDLLVEENFDDLF
ncbi:MAG: DUF4388 domain-containing protein [Candidatus Zixiibacteriota bacterium]